VSLIIQFIPNQTCQDVFKIEAGQPIIVEQECKESFAKQVLGGCEEGEKVIGNFSGLKDKPRSVSYQFCIGDDCVTSKIGTIELVNN